MWLRDSTAQVRPYLVIAKEDEELAAMISGLVKKQFFISISTLMPMPLMKQQMGPGIKSDLTEMNDWIWERKYEIDSLCYPIQLAYLLYKNTGRTDQFNDDFVSGIKKPFMFLPRNKIIKNLLIALREKHGVKKIP